MGEELIAALIGAVAGVAGGIAGAWIQARAGHAQAKSGRDAAALQARATARADLLTAVQELIRTTRACMKASDQLQHDSSVQAEAQVAHDAMLNAYATLSVLAPPNLEAHAKRLIGLANTLFVNGDLWWSEQRWLLEGTDRDKEHRECVNTYKGHEQAFLYAAWKLLGLDLPGQDQ